MGRPTEGPSGAAHSLDRHPAQPLLTAFHPPNATLRGPIGRPTEGPTGIARMRQPTPSTALRGPIGSLTEGSTGTARMRRRPP
eukprot:8586352-Pyramimonas_sp.AAC.1